MRWRAYGRQHNKARPWVINDVMEIEETKDLPPRLSECERQRGDTEQQSRRRESELDKRLWI